MQISQNIYYTRLADEFPVNRLMSDSGRCSQYSGAHAECNYSCIRMHFWKSSPCSRAGASLQPDAPHLLQFAVTISSGPVEMRRDYDTGVSATVKVHLWAVLGCASMLSVLININASTCVLTFSLNMFTFTFNRIILTNDSLIFYNHAHYEAVALLLVCWNWILSVTNERYAIRVCLLNAFTTAKLIDHILNAPRSCMCLYAPLKWYCLINVWL